MQEKYQSYLSHIISLFLVVYKGNSSSHDVEFITTFIDKTGLVRQVDIKYIYVSHSCNLSIYDNH